MFGEHFYHKQIRNTVIAFGTIFNNINILKDITSGLINFIFISLNNNKITITAMNIIFIFDNIFCLIISTWQKNTIQLNEK